MICQLRNGVIEYDNIYFVLIDENTKGVRLESESILEFVLGSDKKLNFRTFDKRYKTELLARDEEEFITYLVDKKGLCLNDKSNRKLFKIPSVTKNKLTDPKNFINS
ncbi:hypothetical protein V2P24_00790 [Mycoplasma putrefaciens]|uniref:hypothetical protein n=1 Tax=Mycoplasma putrefaciens TaxID=2123 RepID=UPI003DA5E631